MQLSLDHMSNNIRVRADTFMTSAHSAVGGKRDTIFLVARTESKNLRPPIQFDKSQFDKN